MKITLVIILIQLLTLSCNYSTQNTSTKDKAVDSQSEKINEEIAYTLINNFILDSLYQTNLLAIEAMKFYNTKVDTNIIYDFGRYCSYDSTLFQELFKLNIIDSKAEEYAKQISEILIISIEKCGLLRTEMTIAKELFKWDSQNVVKHLIDGILQDLKALNYGKN